MDQLREILKRSSILKHSNDPTFESSPIELPEGACAVCTDSEPMPVFHDCDICHDTRRVKAEPVVRHAYREYGTVPCACIYRQGDTDQRIGLPVAYRGIRASDLRPAQSAVYVALVKLEWERPLATLAGPSGTGKTYAVAAVGRAVAALGRSVRFYTVSDLVERFRATYDRPLDPEMETARESVSDIHAQLGRVWLLILDDWGQHRRTDMGAEQLFRIISGRVNNRQPTIITTNMAEIYFRDENPALHSRMFGRDADVSLFGGKDMRSE